MAYLVIILAAMLIPWNMWALSQRQLFARKDGKTNNIAVDVAILALEKGVKVEKGWLDPLLYNATSVIHANGVVELRYASGFNSYSVAGSKSHIKFKQAGALFPKGWFKEDIGGTTITHVQTSRFFDRFAAAIKKLFPLSYKWDTPVEYYELSQMDKFLLDMILSGNEDDREYMLKNYGHKVSIPNPMGDTIYLTLDNPIKNNITILRCRGVMPRRKLFGRVMTSFSIRRNIEMLDGVPILELDIDRNAPVGTFHLDLMKNECEASVHFGGDHAFNFGKYKMNFKNGKAGFSVFGMEGDDIRLGISGKNTTMSNAISKDISLVDDSEHLLFYEMGKRLRGLHTVGIIHGNLNLESVGLRESYGRKLPIFRDLENAFRMTVDTEIYERSAWLFLDLVGPLSQWSRAMSPGVYVGKHAEEFLNGYFDGQVSKAVLWECVSSNFSKKYDAIADRNLKIQEEFPHLYNALLSLELSDGLDYEFDKLGNELMIIRYMQNNS